MATKIIYPTWLDGLSGVPLHRARLEYLLRLAALHHNDTASLTRLALELGYHRTSLHEYIRRGYITERIAHHLPLVAPGAVNLGLTNKVLGEFIG